MSLDLQFFINLFFSLLDFAGFTLLSLSIYRIPVTLYWKRLLVIQFVFLTVMLIHDYVIFNKDYYPLSIAATAIILSTVILRIPFLYSSLIWGTGYLLNNIMQTVIVLGVASTGFMTLEEMVANPITRNLSMLFFFLINMAIVYYIEKRRLGFMFIMNRFRLQKRNIEAKDIFIACLFICTISLSQVAFISFTSNQLNYSWIYVLGSMVVISLIGLYITYRLNMKEIDERFSSLRGKNR